MWSFFVAIHERPEIRGTMEETVRGFFNGLKKNADFVRVYKNGKSRADGILVLYKYIREEEAVEGARIGISVSKKVGNSVVRHRIKRRVKEIARLNPDAFSEGCDYVVVARRKAAESDYAQLERSLLRLVNKG